MLLVTHSNPFNNHVLNTTIVVIKASATDDSADGEDVDIVDLDDEEGDTDAIEEIEKIVKNATALINDDITADVAVVSKDKEEDNSNESEEGGSEQKEEDSEGVNSHKNVDDEEWAGRDESQANTAIMTDETLTTNTTTLDEGDAEGGEYEEGEGGEGEGEGEVQNEEDQSDDDEDHDDDDYEYHNAIVAPCKLTPDEVDTYLLTRDAARAERAHEVYSYVQIDRTTWQGLTLQARVAGNSKSFYRITINLVGKSSVVSASVYSFSAL